MATLPSSAASRTAGVATPATLVVTELFDLHGSGLYRFALTMLRDADSAQDVVQDTFVRLIAHVEPGGTLTNARGWLYTVAAHACRDRQRRLGRWLPWLPEADRRAARADADTQADRDVVLNAIRALSHRDRLLVTLKAQGLSYKEIADAAGLRPASVGRLLARALDRLAKQLDAPLEKRT